mmetsp:Transcript_11138/g.20903  ORF Transcript_11138/g.20903 Transcript_11138/m.20903 type:complete len:91 (-) Transcript_11138:1407-1679(-)
MELLKDMRPPGRLYGNCTAIVFDSNKSLSHFSTPPESLNYTCDKHHILIKIPCIVRPPLFLDCYCSFSEPQPANTKRCDDFPGETLQGQN